LQRALARCHRHHLHLLRDVFSRRPVGRGTEDAMDPSCPMNVLRIEHLNKSFGSLVVTDDFNLVLPRGERHVLIGPNGAGKTSLINQIGGHPPPPPAHLPPPHPHTTASPPTPPRPLRVPRPFPPT